MSGKYIAAGLLLAYLIVIGQSPASGLGDTSNHLARAYILADLIFHHGAHFGTQFQYHFRAVPYILPDLLLTAGVDVLGPRLAVASWSVLTFLSVPAALLLHFRLNLATKGTTLPAEQEEAFLLLCVAYLSTDYFFVVGFFAFRLGLACVIVALALIEALRRRWSVGLFALYGAVVAVAYLVHLSTLLFIATIVVVSAVVRLRFRSSSLRHELLLAAPVVVMFAWHIGVAAHLGSPTALASAVHNWGSVQGKVRWVTRDFHRYGGRLDEFLLLLYIGTLLMLIRGRAWRDTFATPRVIESLALATAFLAMYLVLPFSLDDATYVDIRALAPAALFVLLACVQLTRAESPATASGRAQLPAMAFAVLLSVLNLAYLGRHFTELSRWSMRVRTLFADIPRGADVLPVETLPNVWPYMDPSSMVVIDRQASIPYLFSADTRAPQIYFRYLEHRYAPPDDWYIRLSSSSVDWRRIACSYQDILVTRPFDLRRIRIATKPVAETSSAELLAIDPRACARGGRL